MTLPRHLIRRALFLWSSASRRLTGRAHSGLAQGDEPGQPAMRGQGRGAEGVVEIRRRRKDKSRGRLNRPRPPYGAEWTFQFRTVPFSSLRCCRIRALEKTHQDRRRIGRGAYRVVWQNEFAKLSAEKRRLGPDRRGSKILRWRVVTPAPTTLRTPGKIPSLSWSRRPPCTPAVVTAASATARQWHS
jgi:hypothetical protein